MASHEPDLRAEIPDQAEVLAVQENYREAHLDSATQGLLDFALKLTLSPWRMAVDDIDGLRGLGFSDGSILDAVQLIAYFNYINRVLNALGVEPEAGTRQADCAE